MLAKKYPFTRWLSIIIAIALVICVALFAIVQLGKGKSQYKDSPQLLLAYQAFENIDRDFRDIRFSDVICMRIEEFSYQCVATSTIAYSFKYASTKRIPKFGFHAQRNLKTGFLLMEFPSMPNVVSFEELLELNQIFVDPVLQEKVSPYLLTADSIPKF